MKVAFDARELTLSRPPAGIGQYIQGIFSALPEQDDSLQLHAFCHREDTLFPPGERFRAVNLSGKYFGKWSQTAWEYLLWARMIDRMDVDLFHSTAHLVPQQAKTPMVLTVHDLTNFLFPRWYRLTNQLNRSWHLRRGIRQARKIIAVSHSTRQDLCQLFPEAEGKTEVIYEGFDPIFYPRGEVDRKALGLTFQEPFILWVGTTSPRKNLESLLQAFDRVHQQQPDVRLVLIGQRGWKDQSVFDFIHERHLGRFVSALGYQPWEKLPLFYSACTAFVFPSLYEGFGLPVLEAMACGTAVLASRTSSLPELIPDDAALFDPQRPEELAEKLLWLFDNAADRQRLSEQGLERSKRFSWSQAARDTYALYQKALG